MGEELLLHDLMARGQMWSMACYSASDGLDFNQYTNLCLSSNNMAIDYDSYQLCVRKVKEHYDRTGQRL